MTMHRECWCKWCGADVKKTARFVRENNKSLGDYSEPFCSEGCRTSYYEDVGGYDWLFAKP